MLLLLLIKLFHIAYNSILRVSILKVFRYLIEILSQDLEAILKQIYHIYKAILRILLILAKIAQEIMKVDQLYS